MLGLDLVLDDTTWTVNISTSKTNRIGDTKYNI